LSDAEIVTTAPIFAPPSEMVSSFVPPKPLNLAQRQTSLAAER
jgi:hypothetical protein